MDKVLILVVMLAGVPKAIFSLAEHQTMCNAHVQNTSCSVKLGESVYIQMMSGDSDHKVQFKKVNGMKTLFTLKNKMVTLNKDYKHRTEFFISNWTLKIQNVDRSDSGQYSVEVFGPDGIFRRKTFVNLHVAEPENMCIATRNKSCCIPLGRSIYIQVMSNASRHKVWFKKLNGTEKVIVFTLNRDKVKLNEDFKNRTQFFIFNGTLKIQNVERSDSGQYSVEVFGPDGVLLRHTFVHLHVQEDTSSTLFFILVIGVPAVALLLLGLLCVCIRRHKGRKTP
ncbi:hypothetical protein Q5P01_009025 [Channa striata]|uniref:Immunoglobulin domain-containing protein n=1 Tax=Channa striata TaxID=64152 RepID=A0AA88N4M1_CHASR|nr:hypothetical protein Q5P01_009025 [Channa striata]